MRKSFDTKNKEGVNRKKRKRSARSSHAARLSRAGSKIVSAFNEAIQAMQSAEPFEQRFSVRS
jgi:hypothetical protein